MSYIHINSTGQWPTNEGNTDMNKWTETLDAAGIADWHAKTAELDPRYARKEREFYEGCTEGKLRGLVSAAWMCNDVDQYMLARSYLELAESA